MLNLNKDLITNTIEGFDLIYGIIL